MLRAFTASVLASGLAAPAFAEDTSLEGLQSRVAGTWISIVCEIHPQQNAADLALVPTPSYQTRELTYDADGGYSANTTIFVDAASELPTVSDDFAGRLVWHDTTPAVKGAWSKDYVLSKRLDLTAYAPPMAIQSNRMPAGTCGDGPFVVDETRDILGEPCVLLRFVEGSKLVADNDFLYLCEGTSNMLFMGDKHLDGSGFYYPENRPTVGLQQPLIRVN